MKISIYFFVALPNMPTLYAIETKTTSLLKK